MAEVVAVPRFPSRIPRVEGNEVIDELRGGVGSLIAVDIEPIPEALLDFIDDKASKVLALEENGCDHGVDVQRIEKLVLAGEVLPGQVEVIHHLHGDD
jgi:hypothetical protein